MALLSTQYQYRLLLKLVLVHYWFCKKAESVNLYSKSEPRILHLQVEMSISLVLAPLALMKTALGAVTL